MTMSNEYPSSDDALSEEAVERIGQAKSATDSALAAEDARTADATPEEDPGNDHGDVATG